MRYPTFRVFVRAAGLAVCAGAALLAAALFAVAPAAAESIAGEWYAVSSPHFTLYTDAAPRRGAEIAANLERFRAVFAGLSPLLELRSPAPTTILAFRDARSYAPYKTVPDREGARILGQFLSHPDGNYLTLDAGTRLVGSYAVIYHEYVHYFVRHNFPGVPLWFNEGLAEYYSTFTADGEHAYVGAPVERHARWLRHQAEIDLGEALAMTTESRDYHEGGKAGRFYAVSWALVHYLFSGGSQRLDRAADFLLRLGDGDEPVSALEEAFDLRLRDLEQALGRYVAAGDFPQAQIPLEGLGTAAVEVRPLAPADAYFHLGDLLASIGRTEAAEQHFQRALDHRADHADTHAGLAYVRDLQNRFEEAELLYLDAVELGSTHPTSYLRHGRHLLARMRASDPRQRPGLARRARSQLARAVELYPAYAQGWALYGEAHLFGDADAGAGIDAVARARQLLPERLDLVLLEARLELKHDRPQRAEALVEGLLAPRGDPELVASGREAIARYRLLKAAEEAFEKRDVDAALGYFDQAVSATSDPDLRREMEERLLALQERFGH